MKKILLISLITVLAVGLVGCNNTIDVNNSDNVIESGDSILENNTENENVTEDNESGNVESESGEQEENNLEVEDNKENESTEQPEDDKAENKPAEQPENDKAESKPAEQPEDDKAENKPVEQPKDNKVQEGNTESKEPENQNPENNETEDNFSGEDETVDNTENEIPEDDEIENGEEIVVSELEKRLNTLMEKSQVMIRMPMAMPIEAETAFTYIGLTADEFNSSVANAIAYESMIMPANQSVCLIELKDGANVSDIKNKVITNCDPNKWICMNADKCLVVDSGKYVMLVMSTPEDCEALKNAFESEFGGAGEALTK